MNTRIGLIRCEHCGRQFNPHSAARHIPWCAKQKSDSKKRSLSYEKRQALERYKWRIGYKPSNQLNQQQQQQQPKTLAHSNNYKKGSFNSTGTQSSPSASSSASFGTSVNSNGGEGRGRGRVRQQNIHNNLQQQPSNAIISRPPRSISSLSLRGRQPTALGGPLRKSDSQETVEVVSGSRAKSVSDMSDMGSIVESLAKRMDEIYKQNQILLASLSNNKSMLSSNSTGATLLDSDDEARSGSSNSEEQSKCHHCRAEYLPEAVYCHKCGCKLFESSSRSVTPG